MLPFYKPDVSELELTYIEQAFKSLKICGDGSFTKQCEAEIESILPNSKALITPSCTHALEMVALLLDLKPGDEVIFPSFTFVSTVNAFVLRGVTPIFVDIEPLTFNISFEETVKAVTEKTKAVVVVHYGGVACEMDKFSFFCKEKRITLIEDNAHGFLGSYKGRPLGSFGTFSTLSFHETKNLTCGEGGCLIVNSSSYFQQAEIVREKGTNRKSYFRGEIDKYSWVGLGSSMLASELQTAMLFGQLQRRETIQSRRSAIYLKYREVMKEIGKYYPIQLQEFTNDCNHPSHLFAVLMPTSNHRDAMIQILKAKGFNCPFHYVPLHNSKMSESLGVSVNLPNTESIASRLLRLPIHKDVTDSDVFQICTNIENYLKTST